MVGPLTMEAWTQSVTVSVWRSVADRVSGLHGGREVGKCLDPRVVTTHFSC